MKTKFAWLLMAAGLVALSPAAHAAAPAPTAKPAASSQSPADDPAKVAAAREFLIMFHPQTDPKRINAMIDKTMPRMIAAMKSQDPKLDAKRYESETRARILTNAGKVLDTQSHVISRHFTLQELNGLIAFFHSPLGKRLTEEQPKIQADMMQERNRQRMIQGAMRLGKSNIIVKPSGPEAQPLHK